ncbi:cytochrome-c peroxidase [Adhaeribacter sp. BT258]|uniref:Cytochrome-c peroxidase n=1 Tax=Adhaeribacter terrigena TaxID=2793070 RepID=A0ABS1BZC8_9BACT|nr:cytochrome c peroxidase [Adhaeribacter terrigena]MBK0402496.1 cytochrome-c peroxidase [Adhaeribacter terrigena]
MAGFPTVSAKKPVAFLMWFSLVLFFFNLLFSAYKTETATARVTSAVKAKFLQDLEILQAKAAALETQLLLLQKNQSQLLPAQQAFLEVKKAYKRTEYLTEYLDPDLAKKLNGAPIPKVVISDADYLALDQKEPLFITLPPEGLQVLEELLYAEEKPDTAEAYRLAHLISETATNLKTNLLHQPLTDKQILESAREEMLRLMTIGITGFDAPAAGHEIELAYIALEPLLEVVEFYEKAGSGKATITAKNAREKLQKTAQYLHQNPDFDTFDRVHFLRTFADPAYAALNQLQREILINSGAENQIIKPVNDLASSLFSEDFLHTAYYAKQDRKDQNPQQIVLGKMLFFDPVLSSNNLRSCASCHNPQKAFSDGEIQSVAFNEKGTVSRNSPTLLNAIFATAYFWDSRAGFLEDQIPEVVKKTDELHSNYEEIVAKLAQSAEYKKLFKQAFKEQGKNTLHATTVNRALSAYLRSLVSLNSPFDQFMRRETETLNASAIRGANLFMGKAACATCHFAPIFNGTVPPRFLESETEVLGVTANADFTHPTLDADPGRAGVVKTEVFQGAFKTPTVRNIALTAPYMHNGAFKTLEEVVEFYDLGGGAGLGLNVPNQTLPADKLELTAQEKLDLIAFMKSLTDATYEKEAPLKLPLFTERSDLNNRPVGGRY